MNDRKQGRLFDIPVHEVCRVSGEKACIMPDQVLENISADYLDPDICRRWILERIHIEGPACPYCHAFIDDGGRLQRFWSGQRLTCQYCNKFFTATTGTFLSGMHMDFRQIFLMLLLMAIKKENYEIADKINCHPETVRLWRNRIKILSGLNNG